MGWLARDALIETRGRARVVAALARSAYLEAGVTLIWIGAAGSPLHVRAIVAGRPLPPSLSDEMILVVTDAVVWRPDDDPTAIDVATVAVAERSFSALSDAAGKVHGVAS